MAVRNVPPAQAAVRARCVHPTGSVVGFDAAEVERSIPERFEKIVRRYPERIAVQAGDQIVTYAELNAMVHRVAGAIWERRGSQAEPIGLLLEKDASLVAAMLGVLKAGKFFVLLDPSFPQARIGAVLEDSRCELIVTDRQNASLAEHAVGSDRRLMKIESIDSARCDEDLDLSITPEALASLLYTSGSTGDPKGVVWDHRDVLHRVMLRTNESCASELDRIALLSSGTGNAITNVLLALLNGATLLPFDVRKDGVARLGRWLSHERISICAISSSLFRKLCDTLTGKEEFADLRIVRLRSEAVYRTDFDLYKKFFPRHCVFVTGIASSEAGQLTTYLADHSTEIAGNEVPVGYPVEDKEVLLVDDEGREVGFNQLGEIAVRSRFLSAGYWRRSELTKERFRRDPRDGDKRLCFTGDLGMRLPDGCLVYKGRKDLRLKIRGFGVEIAEIEKRLLQHPAIREAVVQAGRDDLREAYLIAYFTFYSQRAPSVNELRSFLQEKLPDYMIPATFVALETMPLTVNGKVNREALPMADQRRPDLNTPYAAAETSLEKELAKIWAEVLSLDQVGIHDNFFDLGGDSLSAIRVLARIDEEFRVEMPLSHFFETPTVAALAHYIEKIAPSWDRTETFPIGTAEGAGNAPLSFAQQRLWFLDQLEPESAVYNVLIAFQLTGSLDVTALEQSFNEIVRRHEVLRTVFKSMDGQPYQIVLPSLEMKIPLIDLSDLVSDEDRESELRGLFRTEANQPFDLARGPLLRVSLVELAEDRHVLIMTFHHIVSDGWSMGVLARELSTLYDTFCAGRTSTLPGLLIQYADFARWQLNSLQEGTLQAHLGYWKKQLHEIKPLQLPTDRPRLPVQTARGGRQYFGFSRSLSAALEILSRQHGATLFMTLLAAYQTLFHRYTGQDDIVIGAPIAGRNRSEVEGLIGLFLNMLVLRGDLSGNPTFKELLARVREVCVQAYAHQDVPFEKLVEELHPERTLSRNPLFQVTFSLRNTPTFPLNLAALTAYELEVDTGIARFDLHLFMEQVEGGLRGWIDYNVDLFERTTITRMIDHFHTLLECVIANPESPIESLALLSAAEKHQLLVEWNDTKRDYPSDRCIQEVFEAQAKRAPQAVAVVFEDKELSYRELNARANQLAHYLRELGVEREAVVGICVERSLEMVVGLLGILKAGGAYVALDPTYPKERLTLMLEDSRARVVLTEQRLIGNLPENGATVVCLDSDWQVIANEKQDNPGSATTAENLAYVIYTSGSTGKPKGVSMPHRGVVRLVKGTNYAEQTEKEVFLQFAPLSFDASTFEIWGCLLNGAKLVVFPPYGPSLQELGAVLEQSQVTTLWLTSALFHAMVGNHIESLRGVKQLLAGGDVLSAAHVKKVLQELTGCRLINGYGPTENTTFTCCYPMTSAEEVGDSVSIGRPIANTQVYILDHHLNLVPRGVCGEVYVGGAGLARGYLNHSDLTAEKFIPHPFSDRPGERLYRTGDLARYLVDGNIEFLGRVDHQVKVRGYRIELGEIEAVLRGHPQVSEAAVLAREDDAGEKRLVAYVVTIANRRVEIGELRSFLKTKLPEYMLPSAFVFLESLPLSPNGKVDRRALPAPDQSRSDRTSYVAPRCSVEEVLAGIWADVLKLERVGIHDNFFDLGGHSLLATRVISRIRESYQVEMPLRALFETPTVGGLAESLETICWLAQQTTQTGSAHEQVEL